MPENDPRCATCDAECCRYISVSISTPRDKADRDEIRWFLRHKKVNVYIDHEKNWILEIITPCEYLENGRCTDYENRPDICRDYDPDICPPTLNEPPYRTIFQTVADYEEYRARKKKQKEKKKKKNKKNKKK